MRLGSRIAALLLALGSCCTVLPAAAAPAISVVIDDLGDTLGPGLATVALPGPVACAFLPESPHTRRLAAQAHAAGKPVLVHLPLQPRSGKPHPLAVKAEWPDDRRSAELQRLLGAVPHARGVNNHQGSRATESRAQMHWLMRELSLAGIAYFVDSATSPDSEAYGLARAYGLPALRRRVFLDNEPTPSAVNAEFDRLLRIARRDGAALAIGHPHAATLEMLRVRLAQLPAEGIELLAPTALLGRLRQPPVIYPARLRYDHGLSIPVARLASPSAAPGAQAEQQAGATE